MLGYDLLFNMTCLLLEIKEKSCFKLKLKNIENLLKNDVPSKFYSILIEIYLKVDE
jgi:hypothetical protein